MSASKKFVPYVNINAMLDDKPDQDLLSKMGRQAWPTIMFVDSDGKKLFEFYPGTEDATLSAAEDARIIISGKSGGDGLARARAVLLEAIRDVRQVSESELETASTTPGIDAELLDRFRRYLAAKPIMDAFKEFEASMDKAGQTRDSELAQKAEKKVISTLFRLYKAGKTYSQKGEMWYLRFWDFVFKGAYNAKDRASAEAAITAIEASPSAKQYGPFIESLKQKLKDL